MNNSYLILPHKNDLAKILPDCKKIRNSFIYFPVARSCYSSNNANRYYIINNTKIKEFIAHYVSHVPFYFKLPKDLTDFKIESVNSKDIVCSYAGSIQSYSNDSKKIRKFQEYVLNYYKKIEKEITEVIIQKYVTKD